jgi:hypothetical protein
MLAAPGEGVGVFAERFQGVQLSQTFMIEPHG